MMNTGTVPSRFASSLPFPHHHRLFVPRQQAFATFGHPALPPHQQQQHQPLAQSGPPHSAGTAPGGFVPHYGAASTPQNTHHNHHLQQQQQFRPQHQVPQQYPGAALPQQNSPYPIQQQPPQPGYAQQQRAGYSQTPGGGVGGGGGPGLYVPAAVAANQDPFAELTVGGGDGGNNGHGQGSGEDGKIQVRESVSVPRVYSCVFCASVSCVCLCVSSAVPLFVDGYHAVLRLNSAF